MPDDPKKTNPLHGVTLEMMLKHLEAVLGWPRMLKAVDIRCFRFDPSIKSSLVFLRRTPWARVEVEKLYVKHRLDSPRLPRERPGKGGPRPSAAPTLKEPHGRRQPA